jgi:hypothetical protein
VLEVLPADQRLHALDVAGLQVGLGLVVEEQLVALQGLPQAAEERQAPGAVLVDRGVVDHEAGVGLLGRVHGHVRVLEQLGRVVAVVGVDGDADTGVQAEHDRVEGQRLLQGGPQFLGDRRGSLRGRAGDQHGELVAARAGHGVDVPQRLLEPRPHLTEELVSVMVAEGVVDVLEPVQVQQQQDGRLQRPVGGAERLAEPVGEQRAVGQAGERVVQRLVVAGGGLVNQPPLVADQHEQEAGQGGDAHGPGHQGRRDQGVLSLPQPGQAGGGLGLLAGGQRRSLLGHVQIGRMDPLQVDLVGGPHVLGVDRVQRLPQQPRAGDVAGLQLAGLGGVVRLAVLGQLGERDLQGLAGVVQGRPELGVGRRQVRVADGMLLVDLVADLDPGVTLGADALDLPDGPVDRRRRPDRPSRQREQHRGQAGTRERDQPAKPPTRATAPASARAVSSATSAPLVDSSTARSAARSNHHRRIACAVERFDR